MTCPHCGNEADWYELEDGRSRCSACFATYDANREEPKAEVKKPVREETKQA